MFQELLSFFRSVKARPSHTFLLLYQDFKPLRNPPVICNMFRCSKSTQQDSWQIRSWGKLAPYGIPNLAFKDNSQLYVQVCNHKFHSDCLRQWGDESCPVCRYCANATTSNCATCGTSQVWDQCLSGLTAWLVAWAVKHSLLSYGLPRTCKFSILFLEHVQACLTPQSHEGFTRPLPQARQWSTKGHIHPAMSLLCRKTVCLVIQGKAGVNSGLCA